MELSQQKYENKIIIESYHVIMNSITIWFQTDFWSFLGF